MRFERNGVVADLDEAVIFARDAVRAAPAFHSGRHGYLSNLSNSLRIRFERFGAITDLQESVTAGLEALAAAPADDRVRVVILTNLVNAYRQRHERTRSASDLDEALIFVPCRAGAQCGVPANPCLGGAGVRARRRIWRACRTRSGAAERTE